MSMGSALGMKVCGPRSLLERRRLCWEWTWSGEMGWKGRDQEAESYHSHGCQPQSLICAWATQCYQPDGLFAGL